MAGDKVSKKGKQPMKKLNRKVSNMSSQDGSSSADPSTSYAAVSSSISTPSSSDVPSTSAMAPRTSLTLCQEASSSSYQIESSHISADNLTERLAESTMTDSHISESVHGHGSTSTYCRQSSHVANTRIVVNNPRVVAILSGNPLVNCAVHNGLHNHRTDRSHGGLTHIEYRELPRLTATRSYIEDDRGDYYERLPSDDTAPNNAHIRIIRREVHGSTRPPHQSITRTQTLPTIPTHSVQPSHQTGSRGDDSTHPRSGIRRSFTVFLRSARRLLRIRKRRGSSNVAEHQPMPHQHNQGAESSLYSVSNRLDTLGTPVRPQMLVVPIPNGGSHRIHHPFRTEAEMFDLSSEQPIRAHTTVDYHHYLVPALAKISNCGFYWGEMDRYAAETLLENKPEGTFLLRDSSQDDFVFSVSFRRYGRSLHARIEQWNHMFSFDAHESAAYKANTVNKLIEHYKDPQTCMFFEPLLTRPLNKPKVFSLKQLTRAVVCDHITYDAIDFLPIPKNLQEYLRYYHYKQKVRVRFHSKSREPIELHMINL